MKLSSPLRLSHTLSFIIIFFFHPISSSPDNPHCPSHCGAIDIPFPFGLGPNCSLPNFHTLLHPQPNPPPLSPPDPPIANWPPLRKLRPLRRLRLCLRPPPTSPPSPSPRDRRSFVISSDANRLFARRCDTVAIVSARIGARCDERVRLGVFRRSRVLRGGGCAELVGGSWLLGWGICSGMRM
ncbi:uncharacterized protein A4U43_C01F1870 [Asparagus officinalis]|uniref:Wall-associated receptor kinase galacturonan-binding domain-containing protein n=1 Tax=Asparagus officinalis TaxID=4686 RepID=A0A5P1FMN5_ASPOF|nr:uncharacterized protein A4U43_C01F1870 [Asparagus officinalis]